MLNSRSLPHCMVVATHGKAGYAHDTVESFIKEMEKSTVIAQFIKDISKRIVLVELSSSDDMQFAGIQLTEMEKILARDMVMHMVGKVMKDNTNHPLLNYADFKELLRKSCFPAMAIVYTQNGKKRMDELHLNDEVLVENQHYEKIIIFSHAANDQKGCFLSISTDGGKVLSLSPGHLVHVGEVGQLKPAKDVKVGDVMFAFSGAKHEAGSLRPVKVTEISKEWFTPGIYCPHTPGGSIIVDGVLASCYTDLMSPTLAHTLMYPVRMLHRVLPEDWFGWLMPYNSEQGMPKVVWNLRNMIPFLKK